VPADKSDSNNDFMRIDFSFSMDQTAAKALGRSHTNEVANHHHERLLDIANRSQRFD
jgi:hypothetical protein